MIERGCGLSVVRQCEWLVLPCSTFYYQPAAASGTALERMRRIGELRLAFPWMGSRSL